MGKVQIEQTNCTQFSVQELEQRLEMTAMAAVEYDRPPIPTTEDLLPPEGKVPILTWYF